jgi:methionyl aminopeptidase
MDKTTVNPSKEEGLLYAGKIAAQALDYTCREVKAGVPLLKLAEIGEQHIRELGGRPAFPMNISVNHHAAHYTPSYEDTAVVPEKALVKIDIGVHVDGYIADTARTVSIGGDAEMELLIQAAEAGLSAAIASVRSGIRVWEVSKEINKAIRSFDIRPIENLTGHSIERFNLHAGISVPAIAPASDRVLSPRLKEGMVIAIEPFTTYSPNPRISNIGDPEIFGFAQRKNPSNPILRQLFSQMKLNYAQLPFAARWLTELIPAAELESTLKALQDERCIHGYAVLGLHDGYFVAQAEHTVLVNKGGCIVTTKHS